MKTGDHILLRACLAVSLTLFVGVASATQAESSSKPASGARADGKVAVLDLTGHEEVFEKFKDCSAHLWFDRQHSVLIGSGLKLSVPKRAVNIGNSGDASMRVKGGFHGFPVEKILVPTDISRIGVHHENRVVLRGKVNEVRDRLAKTWGIKFNKGEPMAMDPDPEWVAYYLELADDPLSIELSLDSLSLTAPITSLTCRFLLDGETK